MICAEFKAEPGQARGRGPVLRRMRDREITTKLCSYQLTITRARRSPAIITLLHHRQAPKRVWKLVWSCCLLLCAREGDQLTDHRVFFPGLSKLPNTCRGTAPECKSVPLGLRLDVIQCYRCSMGLVIMLRRGSLFPLTCRVQSLAARRNF